MAAPAKTKLTRAQQYKQRDKKDVEYKDCVTPSGSVFTFVKPSKYVMLFHSGSLPQTAASNAVEVWRTKGLIPEDLEVGEDDAAQIKLAQTAFELRDKVLELSHDPKLVVGEATKPNELSTDDIDDEDLDYIFRWVSAGGDESLLLSRFSPRSRPDALASASRPKQRSASQSNGGGQ